MVVMPGPSFRGSVDVKSICQGRLMLRFLWLRLEHPLKPRFDRSHLIMVKQSKIAC